VGVGEGVGGGGVGDSELCAKFSVTFFNVFPLRVTLFSVYVEKLFVPLRGSTVKV
jgi:hypothetical protein